MTPISRRMRSGISLRSTRRSCEDRTGADFPMEPREQLKGAIEAVWRSWTLKKAVDYRRQNNIPESLGTAVNVVSMVFGNLGERLGHRRRVHARSVNRGEALLR